ncbi:MAG: hypothetical protein Q9201_001980 [Fulgogasparrea decipioides]
MSELYKQAQSKIPATISLPSHWLKSYEDFVTKNASRFRESELASETLHTSTLLLSLYHTSLLRRHFPSPFPPSPQTRYTTHYTTRSRLYSHSVTLLQTIQYTELLCEMFFKRRGGDKARWRLVVVLEIVKAICRTIMFWITGKRMVVEKSVMGAGERPQIPEFSESSAEERMGDAMVVEDDDGTRKVKEERSKEWTMPRTGMTLPVLPTPSADSISSFLSARVISADDIKAASQLVRKIGSAQGQVAEMMWILRPVLYALAMQRLQGARKKDWRPWLLGLGMEVAARELGKKEATERTMGGWRVTGLEKEELKRRRWGIAWWGMRGAFYENVTR